MITAIRADPRHLGVTVMIDHRVAQRSFDGWSMAHTEEQGINEFATFRELVDQLARHSTEPRLRGQMQCFAQTFAVDPLPLPSNPWRESVG